MTNAAIIKKALAKAIATGDKVMVDKIMNFKKYFKPNKLQAQLKLTLLGYIL